MSYVPHSDADRQDMLAEIGVGSVEELFVDVPEAVRYPEVRLPRPLSEMEILAELRAMSEQNADLNHYACFVYDFFNGFFLHWTHFGCLHFAINTNNACNTFCIVNFWD